MILQQLILNWFVKKKELFTDLYVHENKFSFNEDSGNVVLSVNEMGILNIDLININIHHNFDEDAVDTITHTQTFITQDIQIGILNLIKAKHLKIA